MSDVSRILSQIESGDPTAAEQLLPLVYDELRKLASARLAHEKPGQTLQATALVHEAYLRLAGGVDRDSGLGTREENEAASAPAPCPQPLATPAFHSRGHFFAAAAEAMRRILVENARRKNRLKHGGQFERVELDAIDLPTQITSDDLLALNEALAELAREDPTKARLVTLRYFAGLTIEQAAEALDISRVTAHRYWTYARAWLRKQMAADEEER